MSQKAGMSEFPDRIYLQYVSLSPVLQYAVNVGVRETLGCIMSQLLKPPINVTSPQRIMGLLLLTALLIPQRGWTQTPEAKPEMPELIELRTLIEKTDNYPIDLQTVLKLIEAQNLPLAENKVDVKISQSQLHQKQAALLPS